MEAYVGNVSKRAVATELVEFLERVCGAGSVISCVIETSHGNWMSKGFGYVLFSSASAAGVALQLAQKNDLVFFDQCLKISIQRSVSHLPVRGNLRVEGGSLFMGFMKAKDVMDYIWSCTSVAVEFCFGMSQLHLLLEDDGTEYKLELQFQNLHFFTGCLESSSKSIMLLRLFRPPQVFKGASSEQTIPIFDSPLAILRHFKSLKSDNSNYSYSKFPHQPIWARTVDFTPVKAIAQSLFYCLEFPDMPEALHAEITEGLSNYHYSSPENEISLVPGEPYASQQELVPILASTDCYNIPLEVVYKLNYVVQSGHLSPAAVTDELLRLLQEFPEQQCVVALEKLITSSGEMSLDVFDKLKDYLHENTSDVVVPDEGQTYVKRLLVTPTKVYCVGPELEGSNGVTRKYKEIIGNFLRVSFVDENFGPLYSDATCQPRKISLQAGLLPEPSDVYHRVLSVVRTGFRIGGKHFQFLAFSASQLREHSLWMFADCGDITAESIRQWMGNFQGFRNVAKCAARIGQSFSSSRRSLDVPESELHLISDIERRSGGILYCFSDGIGKISKSLAINVARECNMETVPSAFQIRYGGYKGVVAVDPTLSAKLSLRPSMLKFPSERTGLDILKWSQYAPYYLNRQIIILMSTLGVRDEVFERMQEQEIQLLDYMLKDPEMAMEVIRASSSGESHAILVEMLLAGYTVHHEPFLRNLMASFRSLQLYLLRIKSRIYVPKGRCLLGCLDETAALEYGQVFVQVSPTPGTRKFVDDGLGERQTRRGVSRNQEAHVVLGKVVIAKNPCLHPGDLLVLEAVDIPALHHMVDCVVFPQRGKRPHPNECSGSDLDGDLYFVSWDKSLIPPSRTEPMSYEPSGAAKLDHQVTLQEIQEFFVDSMVYDSLGVISNAHLVHADREQEKAGNSKCLQLAKLASAAVDFAKTGIPAVIPVDLRPRDYPDFMENEFRSTYISESILGKLYRSLKLDGDAWPGSKVLSQEQIRREYDSDLLVHGYEQHVPEAISCKRSYDRKLTRLLNHYEVSEAEVITGNVLRFTKVNEKQRGDTKDRITFAVKALIKETSGWFQGGDEAKAYSWYHVTYHPDHRKECGDGNPHLLSFPWVVSRVAEKLLKIKKQSKGMDIDAFK